MKFLVDNALSPLLSEALRKEGWDTIHVREYKIHSETDEVIFDRAAKENRILVSADTDFGTLLALRKSKMPSLILFRHDHDRRPDQQSKILLKNIPNVQKDLEKGCIVVIEESRIRIRSLPIFES